MPQNPSPHHKALRLIVLLNIACLLLVLGMMWVTQQKAAQAAASRAAYAPVDAKVRDLIENERDIEKLRHIARIENISASGAMQSLLHMSGKTASTMMPGVLMPLITMALAGIPLLASRRRATQDEKSSVGPLSHRPRGCL